MKNKVAFIIPYYGDVPSYFSLWLKSAEKNFEFNFLIYSDLHLNIKEGSNVKQINMSFKELKNRIEQLLNRKICLKTPYKLCDYRPVYGMLFEDDLKEYDFWGFMDIDLILGCLATYISDKLLDSYDKLYYEGHFSLFRNCKLMNTLFMRRFSHVIDWEYAFSTNYACHFDENGTVAWAHEVDPNCGIRYYNSWDFLDVPVDSYEISDGQVDGYVLWIDGLLKFCSFDGLQTRNLMYIHLQKRRMNGFVKNNSISFAIARNTFYDLNEMQCTEYIRPESNIEKIEKFKAERRYARRKQVVINLINGALRARIYRRLRKWKSR